MKLYSSLLLSSIIYKVTSLSPNIVNIGKPVCTNCKFYKPNEYSSFDSELSNCQFYGKKNIHNGKITYEYAELCRNDEKKCGIEGVSFEEEPNLNMKKNIHYLKRYSFIYTLIPLYLFFLILYIKVI